MTLTDFQKTLVGSILAGKCDGIESFLNEHCDWSPPILSTEHRVFEGHMFARQSQVFVLKDDSVGLNKLKEFVSLWDKLDRRGLIYTSSLPPEESRLRPVFTGPSDLNSRMLTIMKEFYTKQIIAFPELSDFVARGYLTSEEYFLREENRDRKRAQRLTLIIAVVSILVGAILQYVTYTTDRTVYIKNSRAFSDTTKVIILNRPTNMLDTNRSSPRDTLSSKK